jgi:hypothetical protein
MIVDRRFRGAYCLHHQGWVHFFYKTEKLGENALWVVSGELIHLKDLVTIFVHEPVKQSFSSSIEVFYPIDLLEIDDFKMVRWKLARIALS